VSAVLPALSHWPLPEGVEVSGQVDTGLINTTCELRLGASVVGYLQRLNTSIFVPQVHEDIAQITGSVEAAGLCTPRLIPCVDGSLWHKDSQGGVWRCLTPVGERTMVAFETLGQAQSAGELVGRWHSALTDFDTPFQSVRPGAHDTEAHMAGLQEALREHRGHRLFALVEPLAAQILAGWGQTPRVGTLPRRVIHGDLKVSNLRFTGDDAVAIIDLDTCAYGTIDAELGDALRSWCNRASEDDAPRFDVSFLGAALRGYARGAKGLTDVEWAAIVPGLERICWELSSRFCRDALEERYFGWDERFGTRGDHNLARAQGQAQLASQVALARTEANAAVRQIRAETSAGS